MFAAADNRADVIAVLAKRGADLKATSKLVDLNNSGDREKLGAVLSRQSGNRLPARASRAVRGSRSRIATSRAAAACREGRNRSSVSAQRS